MTSTENVSVSRDGILHPLNMIVTDEGADMPSSVHDQIGSSTPLCHGSASGSQDDEQLIGLDRPGFSGSFRRRRFEEDSLVKTKLKGFYCVTGVLVIYTTVYFTYLLINH